MRAAYEISIDGQLATPRFAERMKSLSVREESGGTSDSLMLELEDAKRNLKAPSAGTNIEVSLGYPGALRKMGAFFIDEITSSGPPDVLKVSAKAAPFADAAGYTAFQATKTCSWDASTLGTVAGSLAKKHGLTLEIQQDASSLATPHLDQTAESDMHFLSRICGDYGYTIKPMFGHLVIIKSGEGKDVSGKAIKEITITRQEVTRYTFSGIQRNAYTGVITRWHDVASGKEQSVLSGSGQLPYQWPTLCSDAAEAKKKAEAILARMGRKTGDFNIEMPGRSDLIAEGVLILHGFNENYDSVKWQITSVEHRIDVINGYVVFVKGKAVSRME